MCPVMYLLSTIFLVALWAPAVSSWIAKWPNDLTMHMEESEKLGLSLYGLTLEEIAEGEIQIRSENAHVAIVDENIKLKDEIVGSNLNWTGSFNATGNFLGKTKIYCQLIRPGEDVIKSPDTMSVTVIRKVRMMDHIFTGSVATLVSILYINFGAALNWSALGTILRKPIGPVIGFFGQFLFMPLISYGLGAWLFPTNPEMALGLFFTGVSPAGGASNIWTVILGGNMDLSVTMTAISTLAAFAMMPMWIFTLGKVIFNNAELGVPYQKIGTFAAALIIPLAIGYAIQRYLPRLGRILVRILKPFSTILILFIVIFAIVSNLYLFELFSWKIIVAGIGLPWFGYCIGWLSGTLFKQSAKDVLAIALEVGIQNTGIAIFLLRFSLPQPAADLTTVIPVSVAIMTPIPLMCIYVYQLVRTRCCSNPMDGMEIIKETPTTTPTDSAG